MALSLVGWLNGISITGIIIFSCAFGLYIIYESKKTNAKLLFYYGLLVVFIGLLYLGNFIDFLSILLTGNNIDNSYGIVGILCGIWAAPLYPIYTYICCEILFPKIKWYLVSISLVLGILIVLLFIFDPNSFTYIYPATSGEDLIDDSVVIESPAGILVLFFFIINFIFFGFGFLIKAIQLTGVLRKKYLLISLGYSLGTICQFIDSLTTLTSILLIVRIGILISFWLQYLGLREEPEKTKKIPTKKEVKVEKSLFRISKRPDQITEEEVIFHREKMICLVCKGKVGKFMFMCSSCEAFYCDKCTYALIQSENACWVCNTPLLESKHSTPFKRDEEEVGVETSEKPQKKPKTKK